MDGRHELVRPSLGTNRTSDAVCYAFSSSPFFLLLSYHSLSFPSLLLILLLLVRHPPCLPVHSLTPAQLVLSNFSSSSSQSPFCAGDICSCSANERADHSTHTEGECMFLIYIYIPQAVTSCTTTAGATAAAAAAPAAIRSLVARREHAEGFPPP